MATADDYLDGILDKLVKDVEMAVHSLYRGDARQNTVKARTEVHRRSAREALAPLLGATPRASAAVAAATAGPSATALTAEEAGAVSRCVTGWLSMGAPSNATPESKCVAAGKELVPTWRERELARVAIRRISPA